MPRIKALDPLFVDIFLRQTNRYRAATEPMRIPRTGSPPYPINTIDEIKNGRSKGGWVLKDFSLGTIQGNRTERPGTEYAMLRTTLSCKPRKVGIKSKKKHLGDFYPDKWWFVWHDPHHSIQYLWFDLDKHSNTNHVSFENNVKILTMIAELLGGECMWVTSPGNIYDGQHIQGRYCFIILDGGIPLSELQPRIVRLKERFSLPQKLESFNLGGKNIRLPGFRYVELCDANGNLIDPYIHGVDIRQKPYEVVVKHLHSIKRASLNKFMELTELTELTEPVVCPEIVSSIVTSKNKAPISCKVISELTREELLEEGDTYLVCNHLSSKIRLHCHRYGIDKDKGRELLWNEFMSSRHLTGEDKSTTATTKGLRDRMIDYTWDDKWNPKKFDPRKARPPQEVIDKQKADALDRFKPQMCITTKEYLRGIHIEDQSIMSAWHLLKKQWCGSVHHKERNTLFGNYHVFARMKKKYPDRFCILFNYKKGSNCTQYGLSKSRLFKIKDHHNAEKLYKQYKAQFSAKFLMRECCIVNVIIAHGDKKGTMFNSGEELQKDEPVYFYELISPLGACQDCEFDKLLRN